MRFFSKFYNVVLFVSLLVSSSAYAGEKIHSNFDEKDVVKRAILAAEACYHWSGEVGDQSPERNNQIEAGVKGSCPPAKKLMEDAFSRFPNNRELFEHVLYLYDSGHMNLSVTEKNRLCTFVVNGPGC